MVYEIIYKFNNTTTKLMAQNKQKTALDWFWNEVEGATLARDADFFAQKLQQAKQMEEEQMANFANEYADAVMGGCMKRAEQYYNETYGKQ
jgi:predicted enzyme related to lactoylglutathione lyase